MLCRHNKSIVVAARARRVKQYRKTDTDVARRGRNCDAGDSRKRRDPRNRKARNSVGTESEISGKISKYRVYIQRKMWVSGMGALTCTT
jgi:hypothetical protein